jgi:hypothetical protein
LEKHFFAFSIVLKGIGNCADPHVFLNSSEFYDYGLPCQRHKQCQFKTRTLQMSQIVNALQTQVASAVGGVGTSAKIFQYAPLPFAPSGQGLTGGVTLAIPGTARLNGKQFQVRASGNVTVAGTSPTVQLQLLGAVPGGNNVVLAQSTARTVTTSASYAWTLETTLQGDNLSAILQGWFTDAINNVVDSQAALTNTLTVNNAASTTSNVFINEFSGVSFQDQFGSGFGTGTAVDSGGVTTRVANELLFGFYVSTGASTTQTPGTGWTALDHQGASLGAFTQYQIVASIGTYDTTATLGTGKSGSPNWAAFIVTFSPTLITSGTSSAWLFGF